MKKKLIILAVALLLLLPQFAHSEEWAWDVQSIMPDINYAFSTKTIVGTNCAFVAYGATSGARLLKTSNRGDSWTDTLIATTLGGTGVRGIALDAVDINNLFVVFDDGGSLRFAKSTNGGATWNVQTLDTTSPLFAIPDIKIALPHIYISYINATQTQIKFLRSTDSGVSWNPPVVVEAMPANTIPLYEVQLLPKYTNPTLGNDIKIAYAYWNTATSVMSLRYATSNNQGVTWPTIITVTNLLDVTSRISFDGGKFTFIYPDDEYISWVSLLGIVYVSRTIDSGITWTNSIVSSLGDISQTTSLNYFEQNNLPFVALTFTGGDARFKFAKSSDRGITWIIGMIDSNPILGIGAGCSLSIVNKDTAYCSYAEGTWNTSGKIAHLIPFSSMLSTVQGVMGLGTLGAPQTWNMLRDASVGDQLEKGLMACGLYAFDGSYWNRLRGTPLGLTTMAVAQPTGLFTLLNGVTGVGVGDTVTFPGGVVPRMTWQYAVTGGTLAALTINLEGSIDGGIHWFLLDYSTQVTDQMRHVVNKPVTSIRGNVTGWVIGVGAPTLTMKYVGLEN